VSRRSRHSLVYSSGLGLESERLLLMHLLNLRNMVGQKSQDCFFTDAHADDAKDCFLKVQLQIKELNSLSEHHQGPLRRLQDSITRWMNVE
jgi:hypothetical protein